MHLYKQVFIIIFLLITNSLTADITIAFAKNSTMYGNKPSDTQRVDIAKIKKIAKEKNIKVTFKAVPWKRALLMLEKGALDALMNASYNTKRASFAVYPMLGKHVNTDKRLNDGNTYYIYRHIDSPLRWDGKRFTTGGVVGVREKYAVIYDLKKHQNITIEKFVKNSELIRKLSKNQLNGYAASSGEANTIIKKYIKFSNTIVREPLPIRKKEYFLIFSKKTYNTKSEEMEQIWSGLKEINTNKLDEK